MNSPLYYEIADIIARLLEIAYDDHNNTNHPHPNCQPCVDIGRAYSLLRKLQTADIAPVIDPEHQVSFHDMQ